MTLHLTPTELKELATRFVDDPYPADQYDEDRVASLVQTLHRTADWFEESAKEFADIVDGFAPVKGHKRCIADLRSQIERLHKRATLVRAEIERLKGGAS